VILTAVVMGMAALGVIQEAMSRFIEQDNTVVTLDDFTLCLLLGATFVKGVLFLYCNSMRDVSPSVMALAEDHRNDVLSNTMAVFTALLSARYPALWWSDGLGAIIIAVYIIFMWIVVAKEQMEAIVGKSAPMELLEEYASIAERHNPILHLDIVRAYHFGSNFLVEMEIVLPKSMTVSESHDIAISLQQRLEQEELVERAFVHVDYAMRSINEHEQLYDQNRPIAMQHLNSNSLSDPITPKHISSSRSLEQVEAYGGSPSPRNSCSPAQRQYSSTKLAADDDC
jgi:divalent metal cation (Fe/Co/Zn/Cd) transporter